MIIQTPTARAYYPMSNEQTGLIRGSGRIRYVRGFIVVSPKAVQLRRVSVPARAVRHDAD
jgi:hypothetical protein